VIDKHEFQLKKPFLSVYTVPEDCCTCPDVIWTTGIPSPGYDSKNPQFKSIVETFKDRSEDVLQFGSIYPPATSNIHFNYPFTSGKHYPKVLIFFLFFGFF